MGPKDGLRNRFSVITTDLRYSIALDRDGFADDSRLEISEIF